MDTAVKLAEKFDLKVGQVANTIKLLDEENTIPFIARYRKEMTGELAEDTLRDLAEELDYFRRLEERKKQVISIIDEQDKLTEELEAKIKKAEKLQTVEDLYRPYKQKRQTRAAKARDKGLQPLAELFLQQEVTEGSIAELASDYLDPEADLTEVEAVLQGVRDIIAEEVTDQQESRQLARQVTFDQGQLQVESKVEEVTEYEEYYGFQAAIPEISPHQTLAINRGEEEEVLQVKVKADDERIIEQLKDKFITGESIFKEEIAAALEDGYHRLLAPAIAREVRSHLTEEAAEHAINIFARNLRNLLLQPPVSEKRVLALDPGFKAGCKVAAVNQWGDLLATEVVYPHPPQEEKEMAKEKLLALIVENDLEVIAIGNGTACRETELLAGELIQESDRQLSYVVVNEAGASVYSASPLAKQEFPKVDVAVRGAISIARRLQDPLAELVKIDPKHLGVGLYQHDVNQGDLEAALEEVVESVVNYVGVNLNTASKALLEYVAGVTSRVAEKIVDYRQENGKFTTREELKEVYGVGPKRFTQAAGFLRLPQGENPLDQTAIHPESYPAAEELLQEIGASVADLADKSNWEVVKPKIKEVELEQILPKVDVGLPTLQDIKQSLLQPGRDPREELPQPIFKQNVLSMEDLEEGMVVKGTVRNVVDFGAFVDIGVKEDGLVHISELSSHYVTDPLEEVKVGEVITVKILAVDQERKRISLTRDF